MSEFVGPGKVFETEEEEFYGSRAAAPQNAARLIWKDAWSRTAYGQFSWTIKA
jgi:hypothetical protein